MNQSNLAMICFCFGTAQSLTTLSILAIFGTRPIAQMMVVSIVIGALFAIFIRFVPNINKHD